jgi:hypothetical protein
VNRLESLSIDLLGELLPNDLPNTLETCFSQLLEQTELMETTLENDYFTREDAFVQPT